MLTRWVCVDASIFQWLVQHQAIRRTNSFQGCCQFCKQQDFLDNSLSAKRSLISHWLFQGSGQQAISTTIGILGHSVETLRLVLSSIVSTEPWLRDPYAVSLPWRLDKEGQVQQTQSLNIGFLEHDGIVRPHPPIARALRMVKEALENKGHKVRTPSPSWTGAYIDSNSNAARALAAARR